MCCSLELLCTLCSADVVVANVYMLCVNLEFVASIVCANLGFDLCAHNPSIACTILGLSNVLCEVCISDNPRINTRPARYAYSIGYGSYNSYSLLAFVRRPPVTVSRSQLLLIDREPSYSPCHVLNLVWMLYGMTHVWTHHCPIIRLVL